MIYFCFSILIFISRGADVKMERKIRSEIIPHMVAQLTSESI